MTVIELTKEEIAEMLKPSGWIDPKKFYAVMISAKEFCRIHSISYPTLIRWIEQGIVEPERESTRGNYFFRLSYTLQFDAEKVKGKKQRKLINK